MKQLFSKPVNITPGSDSATLMNTKPIKQITVKSGFLFVLLISLLFCTTQKLNAQYVTIPDTNFVAFLNSYGFASCMNGNMMDTTCSLIVNTTMLYVSSQNLTDITGIQYFDSLKILICEDANITFLPPLPSTLEALNCKFNSLTSLPPLPNTLQELYCNYNYITNLPSLPTSLKTLECIDNLLSSLPTLPDSLKVLRCDTNPITNLPTLPDSLNTLSCNYNQLSTLPTLPNNLKYLICDYNQLTSLPNLPVYLYALSCTENPNLICMPIINTIGDFYFSNTGIQCFPNYGVVNNSNPLISSFPLCGLFNTNGCQIFWNIAGNVYSDTNSDCISDANEEKYSNIKIKLYKDSLLQQTYTNFEGDYIFETDTGLYTIEVDTTNSPFIVVCPTTFSDTAYFVNNDTIRDNKSFAVECKPGFDVGVSTVVLDYGIFRPAAFAKIKIFAGDLSNYYGLHCAAGTSGAVEVIITGPATYIGTVFGALTPTVNGNILTYTIPDFGLVDFDSDFQMLVQTDTLAQIGDQVCFAVNVTLTNGDNCPTNNSLTQCFTIVNSYDPNDKSVSPANVLSINDKKLTYTIRFQNTGNAPAQHIYILDTLDAALDVSTFELLAYSVQPQVQLIGNVLRFNFPNINLPDSTNDEPNSHGYVQYRINLKDNLPLGTIIKNTANIYFDFNPPVVTNTTSNTIVSSVFDFSYAFNNVVVYPNPITNSITIVTNTNSNNCTAIIYDMLGKELKQQKLNANNTQINLQDLSEGNYLLKVLEGEVLVGVKRVVKMND